MRKKLLSSIKPSGDRLGFEIDFDGAKSCPLLCEDNLCYVQRHLGEEALSTTCKGYPRHVKNIGRYQFRFLSMTCPVAEEQALFTKDGINLQEVSVLDDTPAWKLAASFGGECNIANDLSAVDIMLGGLSILQNDSYSFEQRLVLLGLFLDRVEECQDDVESISKLIDYYNSDHCKQEISHLWDNWRHYPTAHKQFLAGIFRVLKREDKISSITPWLSLNFNDAIGNEKYRTAYDDFWIVLERYWQHEWLYHAFPFSLPGTLLHNYFAYLISYEIAKLMIFSIYASDKPINKANICDTLGVFSTMLDHEKNFVEALVKETEIFENEPLKLMQVLLSLK